MLKILNTLQSLSLRDILQCSMSLMRCVHSNNKLCTYNMTSTVHVRVEFLGTKFLDFE